MSAADLGSGVIADGQHLFPIRVYYEDTDAGGIVYHARYLHFAERARTEFLRLIGWPHRRLVEETGCVWAVRSVDAQYRSPARLDDALLVATSLVGIRGATLDAVQIISRDGTELARLVLRLVVLTLEGRPVRIPAVLRDAMSPFLVTQESLTDPCPSKP
jgi:acyl-CoA thioester hydrolase